MFQSRRARIWLVSGLAPWCLGLSPAERPRGAVVDEVRAGFAAARAGLQPGDVLLAWRRGPAQGELLHPLDLQEVEREQAPRGPVTLSGTRARRPLSVTLPAGEWRLGAGPALTGADLDKSQRAARLLDAGQVESALATWHELAAALHGAGHRDDAAWVWLRAARVAVDSRRWKDAAAALDRAAGAAEAAGVPLLHAWIAEARGQLHEERGEWDPAKAAYEDAVARRRALDPDGLAATWPLSRLGHVAQKRGDVAGAEDVFRRVVAARQAAAPDSVTVAEGLGDLADGMYRRGDLAGADQLAREALALHERHAPEGVEIARTLAVVGSVALARGDLAAAEENHRRALALRERLVPETIEVASSLNGMAGVAWFRDDLAVAEGYQMRALAIAERVAPDSVWLATLLTNLGNVAARRWNLAAAEAYQRRALALLERLAPNGLLMGNVLNSLGQRAGERGDVAAAEDYLRRALAIREAHAPSSVIVATTLTGLGVVAYQRGDLDAAERYQKRALAIHEALAPDSLNAAQQLHNLGVYAVERGDEEAAAEYRRRSRAIRERLAPDGFDFGESLLHEGMAALRRRDFPGATEHLTRALALGERLAPKGRLAANACQTLGDTALAQDDRAAAESHYARALAINEELSPGTADVAESSRGLALVHRRRGDTGQALGYYLRALAALDAHREKMRGGGESRMGLAPPVADYYREALAFLVELGRAEEAFHVLERQHARGLLSLLAERDLVFAADIPEELDRQRRAANAEYDHVQGELARAKGPEIQAHRDRLEGIRLKKATIEAQIRSLSPRLAALEYPAPLDLAAVRRALDPGTLLLSYSVGANGSHVFAVGPGPDEFAAAALPLNRAQLREEVDRFRRAIERRTGEAVHGKLSRRLGDVLLSPVAGPLSRARRLLVVPDGPLHLLPFAALADPTPPARGRYLIEGRPLHVAASATVFAEIRKGRRERQDGRRLVAFADPDYTEARPEDPVAPAALRGLTLSPLRGTREEVEALGRLYPGAIRTYLGAEATEERAKALGADASVIHFACHGLTSEESPLNSAIALTIPREQGGSRDNGLLQAWEVFEQVRLDADLVTLSACNTALGREMSGEGMLGLTHAFQYAGARSVLASLWSVGDVNTAELMRRFYGHLKRGTATDAALQAAQVEMIHGRRPHPFAWAAFKLFGDWR